MKKSIKTKCENVLFSKIILNPTQNI